MDPGPGEELHVSAGLSDAYVVKLNSDGDLIWASSWGGPGNESSQSVEEAGNGLIHISGRYEFTADFEPGPGVEERTSNGNYDMYINMLLPGGGW